MANCALCGKSIGFFSTVKLRDQFDMNAPEYDGCADCGRVVDDLVEAGKAHDSMRFDKAAEHIRKVAKNKKIADDLIYYYGRNVIEKEELDQRKRDEEEVARQKAEKLAELTEKMSLFRDIPVTTADLHQPYDVIGPVIFNTTNKGIFSSAFSKLCEKYSKAPYNALVKRPSGESIASGEFGSFLLSLFDLGGGYEGAVGQWQFDDAYYYALAELKLRCAEMGGDAIVGMTMDFDLDTNNVAAFYLQMHGTVVKFKETT